MSLDLFEPKTNSFVEGLPRTDSPPPGVFDNFLYGTGMAAMRGFAKTGRAIDLLGSVGPIVQDNIAGNTEASDKYFKEHEEVFQKAVDYWTPKPNEVGIAGEVVGNLVSMLPQVIASPGMAVGSTLLDAAEDLTKAGVSSPKAISVGVTQALGLGAGIWLPILGQTAAQRILLGGAGFNVAQGIATRGISGEILEGTQAEHQYKAFDPTSLTLDVLLGAAFGTMAHLNPAQREQGAEVLGKIKAWAEGLKPSEIDALATLREAEHLNKDSMPGVPKSMEDIDAHVQAMREGLDQIIRDQPVELSNMPKAQFDTDPERVAQAVDQARFLSEEAVKLRDEYGFADPEHITSQARSIGESVTEKLKATGMEPEEAATNGKLWETAFRYFGKEYGVSPQMLFDRYGLDVQRMTELPGGMEQSARIQTDTPEFKNWFGDSKVVDAEGKPLVVYHGTNGDFTAFEPNRSTVNTTTFGQVETTRAGMFFAADREFAAGFAQQEGKDKTGANVMPAYLAMAQPFDIRDGVGPVMRSTLANNGVDISNLPEYASSTTWKAFDGEKGKKLVEFLQSRGYDGAIITEENDAGESVDVYVAFSPNDIKSATGNRGTFDPNDPNILHQSDKESRDLLIQHNLTAANLLHAVKMGGIPVPSLAITKKDHPLTNFGEITLLGSKEMADPKGYANTKVFGADIYSPRYPGITYKLDSKAVKNLNAMLAEYRGEGKREIYGGEITKVEDLTQDDAFRAYMLDKSGKTDIWDLRSGDMEAEASKMLAEAGAEEKLFRGFDYNGNRRYQPHTLENVVKILKKEMRGGENFNYGVGSIRAKFTPQFRSIEQIRKAKDRLLDKEGFERVKDEIDGEFDALSDSLAPYHNYGEEFRFGDVMTQMMYDAAGMGVGRSLKENQFKNVPVEQQQAIAEFLTKLRNLPAEYFEAKILRDVDLAEFSGAVVPEDVQPEVIEELKSRGIKDIRTYKRNDVADRTAKIGEFENLLFQQNRGAIQFNEGKTLIGMFGAADKSTFAHESSHAFLEMIRSIATHPDAPARAKADYELLKRNLGFDGDTIPREAHEAFAGMNEQYLMEGKAPSKELAPVFERFKAWLLDVYKSVESIIGPRLNTEVRSFLDNLYGQEARTETETPLAKTSPPPPPGEVQPAGASAQKPSQAEEKTILAKTAERIATERGEETITIGQDAEGNPVKQTVKQFLDDARSEVDQAKEDVSLFEMAASCLLKSL